MGGVKPDPTVTVLTCGHDVLLSLPADARSADLLQRAVRPVDFT